jgi:hypothetical protein
MTDPQALLADSAREEQRSRRLFVPPRSILDIEGPPVRVSFVAAWAGFSKDKVIDDAKRGEVKLTWQRCGVRLWAFVERAEATRYLVRLGCST